MLIEYRLRENQTNIEDIPIEPVDIIGFGDEGCIYKIPSLGKCEHVFKCILEKGKKPHFVTPKVSQKYIELLVDIIACLKQIDSDFYLTINDYGLLYELKKKAALPYNTILGRFISREICDSLWGKNTLDDDIEIRDEVAANSIADPYKLSFFESYGVNGMESFLHRDLLPSFEYLKKHNNTVICHFSNSLLAYSRICQTKKMKGGNNEDCKCVCNQKVNLTMSKLCSLGDYESFPDHVDKSILQMDLLGNIVYAHNWVDISINETKNIDIMVVDSWDSDYLDTFNQWIGGTSI